MNKMFELNVGLCKGRHDIPGVDKFFFPEEISDPSDIKTLMDIALASSEQFIKEAVAAGVDVVEEYVYIPNQVGYADVLEQVFDIHLRLYVTGLTPALIAALSVARPNYRAITLMHYTPKTGTYFEQKYK